MMKIFLSTVLLALSLFASNFVDKSTQELLAIIGYVDKKDEKALLDELRKRYPDMSAKEKQIYKERVGR